MQKNDEVNVFGEESDKNVKIASDNTIKNSLINFDVDFSGLKDAVTLFFPSIRHEMILRYRAETIAKIGIEAYKIAQNENIQINPIPPKIALPLIEKMSLEYEPDMYEKWANLLIAAGVKPNPIHLQYADILANLNIHCANILKAMYLNSRLDREEDYNKYIELVKLNNYSKEIIQRIKMRHLQVGKNAPLFYQVH